jgi:hypothetical protein
MLKYLERYLEIDLHTEELLAIISNKDRQLESLL